MAIRELETRAYTLDEFEALVDLPENAERLLELVDGEIVEKVPSELHALSASNISGDLRNWVKPRTLGRVTVEPRHQMPREQQDPARPHSRLPDVAFTSAERALPVVERGAVPQMPDLAVEIQSPGQSDKYMWDTAAYYLANGARMVWLIYPTRQLVEVLTPTTRQLLTINDTIDGGDVLPGFTMPVSACFEE